MFKLFKSNAMKRLTKKCKSKRGATLIELIATIAILAIVSSLSLEAIAIAGEEYRRVDALSECERSISLFQETVNVYAKNATDIEFVENTTGATNIVDVLNSYINSRTSSSNPLQDAENVSTNEFIDIFIYRSGEMTYKVAKFEIGATGKALVPIVTLSGIKEIGWYCRPSAWSDPSATKKRYLLDYAIVAPTSFELLYSKTSGDTFKHDQGLYSSKQGVYSVMTGTVLNNMETRTSTTTQLRMCEDTTGLGSYAEVGASLYKGDMNFVVIRTVPRVAK